MKKIKLLKKKHFTPGAQQEIEKWLNIGVSFKEIARREGKCPTTISRE